MNIERKNATTTLLWFELEKKQFLEPKRISPNLPSALKDGYIVFSTAVDKDWTERQNERNEYGRIQQYVYSKDEGQVQDELKEFRKFARKLGWTIKHAHKSWVHNNVPVWVLHPADERAQHGAFFRGV